MEYKIIESYPCTCHIQRNSYFVAVDELKCTKQPKAVENQSIEHTNVIQIIYAAK